MSHRLRFCAILAMTCFGSVAAAQSTGNLVANPSFELPPGPLPMPCDVSDGVPCLRSLGPGAIPDWMQMNPSGSGEMQPGSPANINQFNYVPDGTNIAYANGDDLSQRLTTSTNAGWVYNLTAYVGRSYLYPYPIPLGAVRLTIGTNTTLAMGTEPSPGDWNPYFTSQAATATGLPITVQLDAIGGMATTTGYWDAINLTGTAGLGWNFDPARPSTGSPAGFSAFEVLLPGDQTRVVDLNDQYNSFVDPGATATYDPVSNQTLVKYFSLSGTPIPLSGPGSFGPAGLAEPHFGFIAAIPGVEAAGEMLPPVQMQWISADLTPAVVPGLGVNFRTFGPTAPGGASSYLIEFVDATADGVTTGNWHEFLVQHGVQLDFTGSTPTPVTLSLAEYRFSSTYIPLDELNDLDFPATGPGWLSIAGVPDGTVLAPGQTIEALSLGVPEPATWTMMLAGFGLAGVTFRARTRRVAEGRALRLRIGPPRPA
jgi:PEP-CTERM motif